eukprot:CAMPEP_0114528932 /NCGR_PEP_ID=MMETSP0109-20121206/24525_1 /TAXON_ID=29199 /ORGANISM="Chlorarachnion reptans, Strain CCCM449" /LENGTH=430 /DNA_ID=CAMNT_0001711221 /DNA_START=228 /DNA_END=1520 /DNA_ORIENTATION=-
MEKCQKVLRELLRQKNSHIFRMPVDTSALPDYSTVIKNPMDLSTVRQRLSNGSYNDPSEFRDDVSLIWENALTYNPPGNYAHEAAAEMSTIFLELLHRVGLEQYPIAVPAIDVKNATKSASKSLNLSRSAKSKRRKGLGGKWFEGEARRVETRNSGPNGRNRDDMIRELNALRREFVELQKQFLRAKKMQSKRLSDLRKKYESDTKMPTKPSARSRAYGTRTIFPRKKHVSKCIFPRKKHVSKCDRMDLMEEIQSLPPELVGTIVDVAPKVLIDGDDGKEIDLTYITSGVFFKIKDHVAKCRLFQDILCLPQSKLDDIRSFVAPDAVLEEKEDKSFDLDIENLSKETYFRLKNFIKRCQLRSQYTTPNFQESRTQPPTKQLKMEEEKLPKLEKAETAPNRKLNLKVEAKSDESSSDSESESESDSDSDSE